VTLTNPSTSAPANRILAALPAEVFARLLPYLTPVSLTSGAVLHQPGHLLEFVYFPTTALVSLLTSMEAGTSVEVALVGNVGVVGIEAIAMASSGLHEAVVAVKGGALRIPTRVLGPELARGGPIQICFQGYLSTLLGQVSQIAACNSHHPLEQRLARWLLTVHGQVPAGALLVTHELLAQRLGVRRKRITVVANLLEGRGLIGSTRGHVVVLDREGLEAASCECYQALKGAVY
jgi:CRP-like cAMP-binding protein